MSLQTRLCCSILSAIKAGLESYCEQILKYKGTYNLSIFPQAIVLKHLTFLSFTQIFPEELILLFFINKNGHNRNKYLVLGKKKNCTIKKKTHSEFLILTTLLANLFLYSYVADFIKGLFRKNEKQLLLFLNITFPLYWCCLLTK